ncbi:transcription factor MYB124-like isoform X1 [Cucurbita moschata]|uniref:Transcription factor MYB124-like isoform X1 n=1 Tax=Cucurbita moschata TaxID=3662 RepID=A0A6J1GZ72_CUCMO|nr:transcription factor MYB124-like isoform X1 [Cucurbita moschata]
MQDTKKKLATEDCKKKERHIVSWTQQEDDILREQINQHGTENWAIIASKFKDKTTRQCRRRWYTYLNSDFKKGGWSPEEDLLLCEAQKIFGNRWTEIAKVVSGRTDNAVKNRFTTLCKKRAKYEALAKENSSSFINHNNKRVLFQKGSNDVSSETSQSGKRIRREHISHTTESCSLDDGLKKPCSAMDQQLRAPFAVLVENVHSIDNLPAELPMNDAEGLKTTQGNKNQETFIKKDDPKVTALTQQAELLSSLALKVNSENTDQSLENAWKILQNFLSRTKENDIPKYVTSDIDLQVEDTKGSVEDLRSSNDGSQWRESNLHESPGSSEYSTGSTLVSQTAEEKIDQSQPEIGTHHQEPKFESGSTCTGEQNNGESEKEILPKTNLERAEAFKCCNERKIDTIASSFSSSEFSSPMHVIPLFRSLAAGIPSPQFSESERSFLLKTLGVESPSLNPSVNPSQPPPCKRALLQSL